MARASLAGKQLPGPTTPRPCRDEDCDGLVIVAQRVAGNGKLTWRVFDAIPVTDDRRSFAHVLVGTQAWRRVDLVEHWHVTREIPEDQARDLVDDYPHHLLHVHDREDD